MERAAEFASAFTLRFLNATELQSGGLRESVITKQRNSITTAPRRWLDVGGIQLELPRLGVFALRDPFTRSVEDDDLSSMRA